MEEIIAGEFSVKLYKLDSKQKERVLHVYTQGATLVQESGLVDGAKVKHEKVCTGKNIGKSNATTPEEQAVLQAESKVAEKLTEGYFYTLEEAKSTEVILPMLADDYKEKGKKVDWLQAYVQPKLDGMRCLIIVKNGQVRLLSRAGKDIITMQHIIDAIKPMITATSNYILDGELYAHGLNFQENMRLLKKVRPGETEKICYNIYDIVSVKPFIERFSFAKLVVEKCNSNLVKLVETIQISGEHDLMVDHVKFLAAGYEGTMIRHGNSGYESNKRSSSLLKYKDFKDISLPIVDITPNEANPLHGTPVFELGGKQFKAGLKMSHAEREEFLTNRTNYIGKMGELRFFEYSEEGIPRFPVMVGFREDK
jgi:DNA ligase-1